MYQKINDEKKICVCKEKCTRSGCVRALGARPPHPRNGPDTTPLPYPNGQNPGKTKVHLGSRVGVGLTSGTAVEETDYRQTPTSPAARWLKLEKWRGWRDCSSTNSKKYGVRCKSCWWRVPYSWTWMLVLAHATLLLLLLIVVVSRIRGAGYVQRTH